MIRKFNTLFLALCLLAWSVITPVQTGQGKQGFKAASGKVVFQNLTTASASTDTAVKKFTDSALKASTNFRLSRLLISSVQSVISLHGFIYRHPIFNTLSAQAP
ncbi:MAG: hypothetical protein KF725_06610 [Cyclobacteriaceae bacterium]|nr:hypothetical protein [Cyclobacteriaceae bacterium]UYN88400.1 MAG: hypothetical protein KIT51_09200 [Cyclobacteriaceae bacterium]